MNDYQNRRLTYVSVHSINYVPRHEPGLSCIVQLQVSSMEGDDHGPRAMVEFFVPTDKDASLELAAEQAVDRALDLLQTIGQTDRDTAKRLLHTPPSINLQNE